MKNPDSITTSWEVLTLEHGAFLLRFIESLTQGRDIGVHSPADMVNEVWMRVARRHPTPPTGEPAGIRALLTTCARNLRIEYLVKRDVRAAGSMRNGDEEEEHGIELATSKCSKSAESKVSAGERTEMVRRALLNLSPEQREIMRLRHFDGLSYVEIGLQLRVSDDCARKRCETALGLVRRELNRYLSPEDLSSTGSWSGLT
jgi:RNA polymerase sigma factor (sigma-70 family)